MIYCPLKLNGKIDYSGWRSILAGSTKFKKLVDEDADLDIVM